MWDIIDGWSISGQCDFYIGASIESVESGVFPIDIPCRFKIVP